MSGSFFPMIARMRYINRWGLMRNTDVENIQEHSHMVAVLAHALAVIEHARFSGQTDPGAVAVAALYHDASEILTGDMPTPIKYDNPAIQQAYKQVESVAEEKLLSMLPDDLREEFRPAITIPDENIRAVVKAADKLSAHIKCLEEEKAGNHEFCAAARQTRQALEDMHLPEVDLFLEEFLPSFRLTLDELE